MSLGEFVSKRSCMSSASVIQRDHSIEPAIDTQSHFRMTSSVAGSYERSSMLSHICSGVSNAYRTSSRPLPPTFTSPPSSNSHHHHACSALILLSFHHDSIAAPDAAADEGMPNTL